MERRTRSTSTSKTTSPLFTARRPFSSTSAFGRRLGSAATYRLPSTSKSGPVSACHSGRWPRPAFSPKRGAEVEASITARQTCPPPSNSPRGGARRVLAAERDRLFRQCDAEAGVDSGADLFGQRAQRGGGAAAVVHERKRV